MEQKRIDELYKQNSKIPFMQSKEILKLGYIYGEEDSIKNINKLHNNSQYIKENTNKKSNDFIGTTKDLIKYTDKKVNIDKKIKKKEEFNKEKIIKEANIKLLGEILMYIKTKNPDFIDIFNYLNNMVEKLQTNNTNNYA